MDVSSNLSKEKPQIVCILGGPGSGKGTQCEKLVRDLKFKHLSVGDLMRAEVQKKTKEGLEIEPYQKEGKLVPTNLTINLLFKAIKNGGSKKYLLDGFPRNLEQALYFENNFREIDFILNYVASDEVLMQRILGRAAQSTVVRADDNPEAISKRLATFHEQTDQTVNFYKQFGKVRDINAEHDPDEVYRLTREALLPNLIFFYGPPASGQNTVAEALCKLTSYRYIDVAAFYKERGLTNAPDEVKMDEFMKYLEGHWERNFVINHFPENIKQARIFVESFAAPRIFYYFDASKDQVEANLKNETKQVRSKILDEYDAYVKTRKDVLKYFKDRPYFVRVPGGRPIEKMWETVQEHISPQLITLPQLPDDDFSKAYIQKLERERGYEYLNVPNLIKDEISRGTDIGKALAQYKDNPDLRIEHTVNLLKKVLFRDILRKKFILGGFPENLAQLGYFQQHCYKIPHALAFTHNGPIQVKGENILSYYNAKGKLIKIDGEYIDLFDQYMENKCRWGFVIGSVPEKNTAVAQILAGKWATKLISWPALEEELKGKFTNEEGDPIDEPSFEQICQYFKQEIASHTRASNFLFDGFPTDKEGYSFEKFVQALGNPTYCISVNIPKEVQIQKYKEENGLTGGGGEEEEEEVPVDVIEEIDAKYKLVEDQLQIFKDLIAKGVNCQIFNVDGNLPQPELVKYLNNIIYKKVILFRAVNQEAQVVDIKNHMMNFCLANNVTFVDVSDLIEDHLVRETPLGKQLATQLEMRTLTSLEPIENGNPSNYTPDLISDVIQDFLFSHPSNKYLLIYGYPAADSKQNDFFPRSLDELYHIETNIGPVREIITVTSAPEDFQIADELEPKIIKEEPKKVKNEDDEEGEGEEGQEEKPPEEPAEEDEDGQKKFDPTQFDWTISDGKPKKLTQIYHKLNCQHVPLNLTKNTINELEDYIKSSIETFEAGTPGNIYVEAIIQ